MTDTELKRRKAICEAAHVDEIDDVSDGFHTFRQLYYQRMMLFATIVKQNKDKAWKSLRHEDGELCFGGGWFVVGIDTPQGSYTYHYEDKYWDMYDCEELPVGKHWDGHTEEDVSRLFSLPVMNEVQMEDIINKHDALILVRNTCRDVMLECTHHYDEGIGDDIYDDMSAVEAVLKCNKRIGKALNELPPVISGGDEDTVSRQSAINIVTPYDTNRAMRDALEDLPAQSENGTAKWITGDKWKKWSVSSTSYCCSNCGWAWARKDQLGFFTFCPNCKKKMEKDIT